MATMKTEDLALNASTGADVTFTAPYSLSKLVIREKADVGSCGWRMGNSSSAIDDGDYIVIPTGGTLDISRDPPERAAGPGDVFYFRSDSSTLTLSITYWR